MTDLKKELADAYGEIIDAEYAAAAAAAEVDPPVFSKRFERRMEKLIRAADSGRSVSGGAKVRRILLIAAAAVVLLAIAACAIPEVREFIAGFFVRHTDGHDEYTEPAVTKENIEEEYGLVPIPENFKEESINQNDRAVVTVYIGENGDIIMLNQVAQPNSVQKIDNENGEFEEVTIGKTIVRVYSTPESTQASWIKDGYYFSLTYSQPIEMNEFIKLIASVRAK